MISVGIIGGGFSGFSVAKNLRERDPKIAIHLVHDHRPTRGRGPAYTMGVKRSS